jgi:hypothetical protein
MTEGANVSVGSCLCRAVSFTVELPSKWCAHCHCHDCRRSHAAAFVTWFCVPPERCTVRSGAEHLVWHPSSAAARRAFCARCGTKLFFEGDRWPGERHVALAVMDDPIDRAPEANAYWDRHVPWLEDVGNLPRYGGPNGNEPGA